MSTLRSWAVLVCAAAVFGCGNTVQFVGDGGPAGADGGSPDTGSQDGTTGTDGSRADGGPVDSGHDVTIDAGPGPDAPPPVDSGADSSPQPDAGLCGVCPAMDLCCADPTAPDYGQCYNPGCLACCMGGPPPFDGGGFDAGDPCGGCLPGEVCCTTSPQPYCYPQGCGACCMGPPPDGGDTCGGCPPGEVCCTTSNPPHCYAQGCLACCM